MASTAATVIVGRNNWRETETSNLSNAGTRTLSTAAETSAANMHEVPAADSQFSVNTAGYGEA